MNDTRIYSFSGSRNSFATARYHEADMPWDNLLPFPEIRDYAAKTDIAWGLE